MTSLIRPPHYSDHVNRVPNIAKVYFMIVLNSITVFSQTAVITFNNISSLSAHHKNCSIITMIIQLPSYESENLVALPCAELSDSLASTIMDRNDASDSESDVVDNGKAALFVTKTTSKIWKYFGFIPDEDGNHIDSDTPMCRLCYKSISAKWANTN